MASTNPTIDLGLSSRLLRFDEINYAKVDQMREAVIEVLQRHGYDIPGVADLCAIAALRAANAYDKGRVIGIEVIVE